MKKKVHLSKAKAFYDDLKVRTEQCKHDPSIEVLSIDHQQNLPVPLLTTGEIFYARQVWVFNQCFHSGRTGESVMYMYDETTGRKGANETVSFLKHYIETKLPGDVKTLFIYSDNSSGQNKNHCMVRFPNALVQCGQLENIVHHFPERGHSFLPCDRSFGNIEKLKRKKEILYLPHEWYNLVSSCSKKFTVVRVSRDMILDLNAHLMPHYKKTIKTNGVPFRISKYKVFKYTRDCKMEVLASVDHTAVLPQRFVIQKGTASASIDLSAPVLYGGPFAINKLKHRDVMKLAKKYVPPIHMPWYDSLRPDDAEVLSDGDDD